MPHKNRQQFKSAVHWTVLHNGSRASGVNVQHPADKMAPEKEKFIVRKSVLMGEAKENVIYDRSEYSW